MRIAFFLFFPFFPPPVPLSSSLLASLCDHAHRLTWLSSVPSSVSFMQADIEEPWPVHEMDYDLIHIQMLLGSIRNWTDLYRKCYRQEYMHPFSVHMHIGPLRIEANLSSN